MFGVLSDPSLLNTFHIDSIAPPVFSVPVWQNRTVELRQSEVKHLGNCFTQEDSCDKEQLLRECLHTKDWRGCVTVLRSGVSFDDLSPELLLTLAHEIDSFSGSDLDFVFSKFKLHNALRPELESALFMQLNDEVYWKHIADKVVARGQLSILLKEIAQSFEVNRRNLDKLQYLFRCGKGSVPMDGAKNICVGYAQYMLRENLKQSALWLEKMGVDVAHQLNARLDGDVPFFFHFDIDSYRMLADKGADMTLLDRKGSNFFSYYRRGLFIDERKVDSLLHEDAPVAHRNHLGHNIADNAFRQLDVYRWSSDRRYSETAIMASRLVLPEEVRLQREEELSARELSELSPESPPSHVCIIELDEQGHNSRERMYGDALLHTSAYRLTLEPPAIQCLRGGRKLPAGTLLYICCHADSLSLGQGVDVNGQELANRLAELLRPECEGGLPNRVLMSGCNVGTSVWKQFGLPFCDNAQTLFAKEWQRVCQDEIEVTAFDGTVYVCRYLEDIFQPPVEVSKASRVAPLRFLNWLTGRKEKGSAVTLFIDSQGHQRTVSKVL